MRARVPFVRGKLSRDDVGFTAAECRKRVVANARDALNIPPQRARLHARAARGIIAFVKQLRFPTMHRSRRRANHDMLRVLFLAFALIVANGFLPWAGSAHAQTHSAHGSSEHCHEKATTPAAHDHGSSSACCQHGCLCLHGSAAPLPQFLAIRAPAPHAQIASRGRSASPEPPVAEHLRPPIA